MTDNQIFITLIIAMIAGWFILFWYARRRFKKTVKKIDHDHKAEQTTLLDDDDIRWKDLGIEYSERPFIKLH